MKKTYIKPEIEVMELHLEGMLATSGTESLGVSDDYTVESSILSNEERGGSLWDD